MQVRGSFPCPAVPRECPQYGDPEWSGPSRPWVFQLVHHPQPELGTLGDLDPDPEGLLAAIDIVPHSKVGGLVANHAIGADLADDRVAVVLCVDQTWLARHPRVHLHFTPTSGSWLNLVEAFFSIITRQALRRGNFPTVADLIAAIEHFTAAWNDH